MSQILSEKEIFCEKGDAWGTWKFSLSEEQINARIASLPKTEVNNEAQLWEKIFSTSKSQSISYSADLIMSCPSPENMLDSHVEVSPVLTLNIQSNNDHMDIDDYGSVTELSRSFQDLCSQVTSKLKHGISVVREEMCSITEDLRNLSHNSLIKLMDNVWSTMSSDVTRLCFCIPFTSNPELCKHLCNHILLNWLSKTVPNKLEDLSKIFSHQGEIICRDLITSLLQIEDSPFVHDVMNLEDVMSSMSETNWTTLLSTLINNLTDIQVWHLPVLATIVDRSSPSSDDMIRLIQLMSSTGTDFSHNRDFGTLLVNAANCSKNYPASIPQLTLIANSYNLPLKFKVLKILNNIKE